MPGQGDRRVHPAGGLIQPEQDRRHTTDGHGLSRLVRVGCSLDRGSRRALLDHVGQLVVQQAAPDGRVGVVLVWSERDVSSDRDRAGSDRGRDAAGRVHPYVGEPDAELPLHSTAGRNGKGLTATGQLGTHLTRDRVG